MSKRYEQVANFISNQIHSGMLQADERIPSVRQCADKLGMSISTVIRGYELLQDRLLIESRPQSGFYVRQQFTPPKKPEISKPDLQPVDVNMGSLAVDILRNCQNKDLIQLAVAIPKIDFPATSQLNRYYTDYNT